MSHCRFCHLAGHNQRTCAKKTAAIKARHDHDVKAGETNSYWIRQYKERIAPKSKKVSQQTCGYCQERGHTRRKCEALQKDMSWFVQHHNEHVRVAHDYISQSPIGIGSLFRETRREYDYSACEYVKKTSLKVLTNFCIGKSFHHHGLQISALLFDPVENLSSNIHIRGWIKNPSYEGTSWNKFVLVSPSRETLPSGWISEQSLSLADAKHHPYFIRVGRKNEDARSYDFINLDRTREVAKIPSRSDRFDYQEEARQQLAQYAAEHNRIKLFKDFESGQ